MSSAVLPAVQLARLITGSSLTLRRRAGTKVESLSNGSPGALISVRAVAVRGGYSGFLFINSMM